MKLIRVTTIALLSLVILRSIHLGVTPNALIEFLLSIIPAIIDIIAYFSAALHLPISQKSLSLTALTAITLSVAISNLKNHVFPEHFLKSLTLSVGIILVTVTAGAYFAVGGLVFFLMIIFLSCRSQTQNDYTVNGDTTGEIFISGAFSALVVFSLWVFQVDSWFKNQAARLGPIDPNCKIPSDGGGCYNNPFSYIMLQVDTGSYFDIGLGILNLLVLIFTLTMAVNQQFQILKILVTTLVSFGIAFLLSFVSGYWAF